MRERGRVYRGVTVAAAVAALAAGAGCGSSSPSSTSTSVTTHKTVTSTGLKPDVTPKFASPSSSEPAKSGVVQIAYRNIAIDPDTVRVKVGTTLRWTNYDPVEHNVTSKSGPAHFASGTFPEGHTFEVKLTRPGLIHYECTIHPTTMNGSIEVVQ